MTFVATAKLRGTLNGRHYQPGEPLASTIGERTLRALEAQGWIREAGTRGEESHYIPSLRAVPEGAVFVARPALGSRTILGRTYAPGEVIDAAVPVRNLDAMLSLGWIARVEEEPAPEAAEEPQRPKRPRGRPRKRRG